MQDNLFEPLLKLIHERRVFEDAKGLEEDPRKHAARETFVADLQTHYEKDHLSRNRTRFIRTTPHKIFVEGLAEQQISAAGVARTNVSSLCLILSNVDLLDISVYADVIRVEEEHRRLDEKIWKVCQGDGVDVARALGILHGHLWKGSELVTSHRGRSAWMIRRYCKIGSAGLISYQVYGLISDGELQSARGQFT